MRTTRRLLVFVLTFVASLGISGTASAQATIAEQVDALDWIEGPATAQIGSHATIEVPEGFRFVGKPGASRFLELLQNPSDKDELGVLLNNESFWFVIFDFQAMGYVKDDDQKLDINAILSSLREGTAAANKVRKERGWPTMDVAGWYEEPYYDETTNNLTWAIEGVSDDGETSINHSTRMLGRRGVMRANLVASPEEVDGAVESFNEMLTGFEFTSGNKYSEFTRGDKVAEYGLAGLIVGGTGVALVKSGLLQKFGKLIAVGFVALLGALKKAWDAMTQRSATA
ncbi:MAG TPA: DUF2167 domain-containing protein [Vicinamibacterales bacterium]